MPRYIPYGTCLTPSALSSPLHSTPTSQRKLETKSTPPPPSTHIHTHTKKAVLNPERSIQKGVYIVHTASTISESRGRARSAHAPLQCTPALFLPHFACQQFIEPNTSDRVDAQKPQTAVHAASLLASDGAEGAEH